jgi:hypothetical protein
MAAIHISGEEASRDFAWLMAMVRSGTKILIEEGAYSSAVLRLTEPA